MKTIFTKSQLEHLDACPIKVILTDKLVYKSTSYPKYRHNIMTSLLKKGAARFVDTIPNEFEIRLDYGFDSPLTNSNWNAQ